MGKKNHTYILVTLRCLNVSEKPLFRLTVLSFKIKCGYKGQVNWESIRLHSLDYED